MSTDSETSGAGRSIVRKRRVASKQDVNSVAEPCNHGPSRNISIPAAWRYLNPPASIAVIAAGKSVRRSNMSTSRVVRTAASSAWATQARTAFPPMIAYGIPARSRI